jgi:hypothetical protein
MDARLRAIGLCVSLASCFAGCAPKELFSAIDRNCFVADWTNHYSCVSCCRNGSCGQAYPQVEYETLVLGDEPSVATSTASPVELDETSDAIRDAFDTGGEQR